MGHAAHAGKVRKWTGLKGKALVDFAKLSDDEQRQVLIAKHRLNGASLETAEALVAMNMSMQAWKRFCKRIQDHRGPER